MSEQKKTVKAVISGSSCTITSTLKLKDLKRYEQLHPEALTLWDDDGKRVFEVLLDKGPGRITKNLAVYGEATNEDGYATITVVLDPAEQDKKEMVFNKMGAALLNLNELESGLRKNLDDLNSEEEEIRAMIESK